MKPLLTGSELRHNARERLKRFREEQKKKGYKTITVFASQELRDELVRLEKEMGLTRQEGLQHIFTQYQQNRDIKGVACDSSKGVSSNADKTPQKKSVIPKDKYPNRQNEIPFEDEPEEPTPDTLPDCQGIKLPVQERDRYLLMVEEMYPGPGQNQKRADALNKAGVRTARGKTWSPKGVGDNLHHAKKRASK